MACAIGPRDAVCGSFISNISLLNVIKHIFDLPSRIVLVGDPPDAVWGSVISNIAMSTPLQSRTYWDLVIIAPIDSASNENCRPLRRHRQVNEDRALEHVSFLRTVQISTLPTETHHINHVKPPHQPL